MPKANEGPRLKLNRETGVYFIHWTEGGRSRRRSTRTPNLQFAQQVLSHFLSLDEQAARKAAEDVPLLVIDVLGDPDAPEGEDYWHEHVLTKVVDKVSARQAIGKLRLHFGSLTVAGIGPRDVDAYVSARKAGRIGRPSVNHTISKELAFLNAAINHAVKKRRLPKGDVPYIEAPGTSQPRDRWLTLPELNRLLDAAAIPSGPRAGSADKLTRIYRFIALAYGTAARKQSVLELTRGQVDLERGLIYLNPKGRAQTNKRRATVPISDWLRPVLDGILKQIPADDGAHLLDHAGCIYTSFDRAVVRAKLGPDVTPHVLRHTRATHMAQAGADLWDIAGILGDTLATVEKTYAHHHPDYLRKAINAGPAAAPHLRVVA